MVRTVLTMGIRTGCEQEFEEVWAAFATEIGRCEGNRGQWLLREPQGSAGYVIMSDWDSDADLTRFESGPIREELSAKLIPLRESAHKSVLTVERHVAPDDCVFSGRK